MRSMKRPIAGQGVGMATAGSLGRGGRGMRGSDSDRPLGGPGNFSLGRESLGNRTWGSLIRGSEIDGRWTLGMRRRGILARGSEIDGGRMLGMLGRGAETGGRDGAVESLCARGGRGQGREMDGSRRRGNETRGSETLGMRRRGRLRRRPGRFSAACAEAASSAAAGASHIHSPRGPRRAINLSDIT